MLGSLLLAYFFYRNYTISVWCFFAAILSLIIFLVIYGNKNGGAFIAEDYADSKPGPS
jgi:VIT1/CCC1 family predicted Fe2+/Mn2+ transporter